MNTEINEILDSIFPAKEGEERGPVEDAAHKLKGLKDAAIRLSEEHEDAVRRGDIEALTIIESKTKNLPGSFFIAKDTLLRAEITACHKAIAGRRKEVDEARAGVMSINVYNAEKQRLTQLITDLDNQFAQLIEDTKIAEHNLRQAEKPLAEKQQQLVELWAARYRKPKTHL